MSGRPGLKLGGIGKRQTFNGRGDEDAVRGALDRKERERLKLAALGAGDKHPRNVAPALREEDLDLADEQHDANADFYCTRTRTRSRCSLLPSVAAPSINAFLRFFSYSTSFLLMSDYASMHK